MKKNGLSHIRKWLWIYVFLVAVTTLTTFTIIYKEISDSLDSPAWTAQLGTTEQDASFAAHIDTVKLRVLLLLTAGLFAIVVLSLVWLRIAKRRITSPMRAIQLAVTRLAQGKLNETVSIESADEFGQISSGINELAANLQELLLYIWKQTGQCITTLEQIKHIPESQERERLSQVTDEHLQELNQAIESLREMAKSYVFYDVHLEGDQTLAINQPGKKKPSDILHYRK